MPPKKKSDAKSDSQVAVKPDGSAAGNAALNRELLYSMLLQRRFEERCAEMYAIGRIGGFCHLYIGQEAVSTGIISLLRPDDYIITTYRDHGQALARGMTPRAVMSELFGRQDGCAKGKGGSMHMFDKQLGFLGGHGIVGGHVPMPYRLFSMMNTQGSFQSAAMLSASWKAPVFTTDSPMKQAITWSPPR